ncbi:MAG: hypothetical protein FWF20_03995 [Betaproteobacteria bacterium]|nr:hypothetical protein [Betaproteobacteria bacterium]MCL2885940.1 hypothetical protein [Betaproteobacteria bacterium]
MLALSGAAQKAQKRLQFTRPSKLFIRGVEQGLNTRMRAIARTGKCNPHFPRFINAILKDNSH